MNYPIIIFLKEYLCIMDEIKTEYRLDVYLHKMGFAESRERAKRLILDKSVFVGGKLITKPSYTVRDDAEIKVTGICKT